MADERNRPGWWQSAPGVMTSTAAVIAAVTGLLGGLSQLGVLDRWSRPAAANPPATPAATARGPKQDTAAGRTAPPTRSALRPTAPSPSPATTPAGQLPSGTTLELAAAKRICSTTSQPGDRLPATVVVRVTGTGGAVVPVGTAVTLVVTRLDAPVFLGIRAGSLSLRGRSYPLRNAQAKVHQREVTPGAGQACIPAGGRITVTLRSPLTFGRGS